MVKNEIISTLQNSNPNPFLQKMDPFKKQLAEALITIRLSFILLNVNFSIKIRFFSQKELHLSQIIQ